MQELRKDQMLGMELLCKVRRVSSASEISGETKVSNIIPW